MWWGCGVAGVINFVDARTKWLDQEVAASRLPQVVVIAAGYDTRAYRFGGEGRAFYEVDLPHASQ
jgi:O-methyltransferase involved in polyketide biosynthesis